MVAIGQVRGVVLEEVLLYLLQLAGYRVVEFTGEDPTLHLGSAGLEVLGRGGRHQIDAVADFAVSHPFSHQSRLLIEAKCIGKPIGLEIVRNAVGVLKDVSEHWRTSRSQGSRYHY